MTDVSTTAFRQVPSGDLHLGDVVALASAIDDAFGGGADGVVVTQGTDTLEETAFALDLLVTSRRPVVVTGAMRNPTLAGADGPANLLAAVQVASSPDAASLGTLVVTNDEIHAARFVRKSHTSSPATFRSPTLGPLGWIIEGRVRIGARVEALAPLGTSAIGPVPPVALVTMTLGDDGRLLASLEGLGYAGLVVEAFGGGHVPSSVVPALSDLAMRMPVVLSSRTGSGEVLRATYSFDGSESDLLRRGLLWAGALDGLKSRVLLSLLLAQGDDVADVKAAFGVIRDSIA